MCFTTGKCTKNWTAHCNAGLAFAAQIAHQYCSRNKGTHRVALQVMRKLCIYSIASLKEMMARKICCLCMWLSSGSWGEWNTACFLISLPQQWIWYECSTTANALPDSVRREASSVNYLARGWYHIHPPYAEPLGNASNVLHCWCYYLCPSGVTVCSKCYLRCGKPCFSCFYALKLHVLV